MMKLPKEIDEIKKDVKVASTLDDLKIALLDIISNLEELDDQECLAEMQSKIEKIDERLDDVDKKITEIGEQVNRVLRLHH